MPSAPFPHRMVILGRQIRHDPQLGHAFVQDIDRRVPHERGAYFARTNAQGFREDHDLEPPPAGFHALCYGDSYAAGDGVDNPARFSTRLAAALGITVSNVAVPGHGPDQNVLQLEQGALPRPDLILWCIAVHTIERIQSGKRVTIDREGRLWQVDRPHFALDGNGALELRGVPVSERGDELVERPWPQIASPFAARRRELTAWLRQRLVAAVGPIVKPPPDPDYADPNSVGWRLLAAIVRRFHTSAAGVPVAIVPLPTTRYLTEPREPHFQRRFAELADPTAGLHVLDVTAAMRRAPRRERTGFCFRSDGHYSASGHAAVAAALADELRVHGLVPAGTAPNRAATNSANAPPRRTLVIGWQLDDGYAVLRAADGAIVAEHRESELTGGPCRPGVLPLSAVHACLDDGHVAGPELDLVVLQSPCTVLLGFARDDPRWFAYVTGYVRWHGAAERDLREFLGYRGQIEHDIVPGEGLPAPPATAPTDDDDELRWLRGRIVRLAGLDDDAGLRRQLLPLARRWELATRAARALALPTAAPLRRGRIAVRLAR
ncbi:MAG: hypothetical protein KDE27_15070 [Planctomycetes bacterium]|nr:hypothetical protein [Planctomycetota bacterium]